MSDTPSPIQLARQVEAELKAVAGIRAARRATSFFKPGEEVWVFGVDTPTQRRIAGGLFKLVKRNWSISEAVSFCELLIKRREMELKNAGILLLARFHPSFDNSLLRKIKIGWGMITAPTGRLPMRFAARCWGR
jgi:hypothetical protein